MFSSLVLALAGAQAHSPDSYRFVEQPRVGDERVIEKKVTFPNKWKNIQTEGVVDRERVVSADSSGETVKIVHLGAYSMENSYRLVKEVSPPSTLKKDLFLHVIFKQIYRFDDLRILRSQYFYPPDPVRTELRVGEIWKRTLNVNYPDKVPPAEYEAEFVGFEEYRGVKCAKVVSTYRELTGRHPLSMHMVSWFAFGLEPVKRTYRENNVPSWWGPTKNLYTKIVTFWKFGPPPFNRRSH
jgi:hypothetical protein